MPRMPTADVAEITSRPTFTSATKIFETLDPNGITAKAVSAVMVEMQGANQKMALSDCSGQVTHFRCEGTLERELRARGFQAVAGVDEVGRGALFGPVVAAAVILSPDRPVRGLNDSKQLDPERRAVLAERI